MPLIECARGTNDVEASHRQLRVTFRNWEMGVELMDALLAEFRHRYNHRISERKIPGFPKIGHFDTWLIDLCQNLVARNHGIRLYPNWSNASDYVPTPEIFGVVALHSKEVGAAIQHQVQKLGALKMTRDMKYLCKRTGLGMPCLPLRGEAENKLFSKMIRDNHGSFNEDEMALSWVKYCDGKDIFPKLPLYLRWHYKKWQKNQKTRAAVNLNSFKTGAEFLKALNQQSIKNVPSPIIERTMPMTEGATAIICDTAKVVGDGDIVGHVSTSVISNITGKSPPVKRARGARGVDSLPRKPRSCMRCSLAKSQTAQFCAGKSSRQLCSYYNEDGTEKAILSAMI